MLESFDGDEMWAKRSVVIDRRISDACSVRPGSWESELDEWLTGIGAVRGGELGEVCAVSPFDDRAVVPDESVGSTRRGVTAEPGMATSFMVRAILAATSDGDGAVADEGTESIGRRSV